MAHYGGGQEAESEEMVEHLLPLQGNAQRPNFLPLSHTS